MNQMQNQLTNCIAERCEVQMDRSL